MSRFNKVAKLIPKLKDKDVKNYYVAIKIAESGTFIKQEEKLKKAIHAYNVRSSQQKRELASVFESIMGDFLHNNWNAIQNAARKDGDSVEMQEQEKQQEQEQEHVNNKTDTSVLRQLIETENSTVSAVTNNTILTRADFPQRPKNVKGQPYKKALYNYNAISGTRSMRLPLRFSLSRRFYYFLQLQKYLKENNLRNSNQVEQDQESELDKRNITYKEKQQLLKKIGKSFSKVDYNTQMSLWLKYENNILFGYDLGKEYNLVTVDQKMGYGTVNFFPFGDKDPELREAMARKGARLSKDLGMKIIINEFTGKVSVLGMTKAHLWNYFLGREFSKVRPKLQIITSEDQKVDLFYGQVLREIEIQWREMSKTDYSELEKEYMQLLELQKDIYGGHIVDIEFKQRAIGRNPAYDIRYIRGEVECWDGHLIPSATRTSHRVPEVSFLRVVRNQTVGNYTIIGELNRDHVWNYFVYKSSKQHQKEIFEFQKEWKCMNETQKQQIESEYRELLLSGYDIFMGKKVTHEQKLQLAKSFTKEMKKEYLVEVWGQWVITNRHSRKPLIPPLSTLLDVSLGRTKLVESVLEVHAYNYFLAKRIDEMKKEKVNVELKISVEMGKAIEHLQAEWIAKSSHEREDIRQEYLRLVESGKDYLYGEIVPIMEKNEHLYKIRELTGTGSNVVFLVKEPALSGVKEKPSISVGAKDNRTNAVLGTEVEQKGEYRERGAVVEVEVEVEAEAVAEAESESESELKSGSETEAKRYYQFARRNYDNEADIDLIEQEWNEMSQEEKDEVQESYELMKVAGKHLVEGEMVDIN